jgi:hypothetical protein
VERRRDQVPGSSQQRATIKTSQFSSAALQQASLHANLIVQ